MNRALLLGAVATIALGFSCTADAGPMRLKHKRGSAGTAPAGQTAYWGSKTLTGTGGMRTKHVNPAFLGVAGYDETEGRFTRGDFVTNRVDLLSELDFTYMRKYGFRVSGAAWNDFAYDGKSRRNTALPVSGAYINDQYNGYVDRYIRRGAEG